MALFPYGARHPIKSVRYHLLVRRWAFWFAFNSAGGPGALRAFRKALRAGWEAANEPTPF
jgi:hypothetical protein